MPLISRLRESVDRTRVVFCVAGCLFAAGVWAYFYGITVKTDAGLFQYDAISLLPGLLAFGCFLTLNLLTDRTVLSTDSMDYFTGSNIRARRFFVFAIFFLTLSSVAIAILLASMRYGSKNWIGLSWGLITETGLISASSFLIFFGRKIEVSFF